MRIAHGWAACGSRRIALAGLAALFASLITAADPGLNEAPLSEGGGGSLDLDAYAAEQPVAAMDRHFGTRDTLDSTNPIAPTSKRTFFAADSQSGVSGGGGAVGLNVADDHGDNASTSTDISTGIPVQGMIGATDDADYFRLILGQPSLVSIYTTGDLDTVGRLIDSDGGEVAANDDSGTMANFRIEANLDPGIHYLQMRAVANATGSYELHADVRTSAPARFRNSVGMEFALVPAGEFYMGSDSGEARERPVRRVQISRAFYMGQHEVTAGQWDAVMGSNRSAWSDCGPDCPVVGVSWQEAREFVRRLNAAEGEPRYRLPTESEWEYAARAGTSRDRYAPELDLIAWYRSNSQGQIYPVGSKRANAFGLHDMLGNAWEWVQDAYGPYQPHPDGMLTDPTGPVPNEARAVIERVIRGGGRGSSEWEIRASQRNAGRQDQNFEGLDAGFRLAMSLEAQSGSGAWGADDHGDGPLQATPLAIGTAAVGRIGPGDEVDYFSLEVKEPTAVAIDTRGSLDTYGSLRDSANARLAGNDDGGEGKNFRIETTLDAGVHFVRVESHREVEGVYTLRVERRTAASPPTDEFTNSMGMEFALVPAGEFEMGSEGGEESERPVTRVRISRAFYMGKHEVTQGQWEAVMGSNPSSFPDCGLDCPVESVSWVDAREFVRRLNAKEDTMLYRLPTEAEWEYAADGMPEERYSADLGAIARNSGNSQVGSTQPVGDALPNAFGLHGMQGNVREWVRDWYGDYPGGTVTDPSGPSGGSGRVFRSGSCQYDASLCPAAARNHHAPSGSFSDLGFRLARTVAPQVVQGTPIADDHEDQRSQATPPETARVIGGQIKQGHDADNLAGTITTVAGSDRHFYLGDGGLATSAGLDSPSGVAVDALGNLYIVDTGNNRVRRVDPAGTITTVAGSGSARYSGDGGLATSAGLGSPTGVAVDALGNLYIADTWNDRVRRVELAGQTGGGVVPPAPADAHGNDPDSATPLSLNSSLDGMIGTVDDEDWFRLEFNAATDVAIYTTGPLGTTGTLLDRENQEVAKDIGSEAANFRIEVTVEAGVYYVRVESHGESTGSYSLHVERQTLRNNYGMEFELVPAGQFAMGSTSDEADSDEQPVRQVEISQAFYMGKHEVTQGQWKAVMGEDSNPSRSRICDECPVEYVTWNDAVEFVRRLNDALETTAYRLPTEAEWEYAARAGEEGERYAPLDGIAWHEGNSGGTTREVGQMGANAFGLHDMLGNVWEWVQDWHGQYEEGRVTDPTGAPTGWERVRRGCSWYSKAEDCRLANRYASGPMYRSSNLGLRLVMTYEVPSDPATTPPTDDHGDLPSKATQIACSLASLESGCSVGGTISNFGDRDVFRLVIDEQAEVLIYTTGSLQAWGTVWREAGEQDLRVVASENGTDGAGNFLIKASLEPGTYFVRVKGVGNAAGDYTLHAQRQKPADVVNDIGMEFVRVPAGDFSMGSSSREARRRERPVTKVNISQDFYMGRYEVTQGQWNAVMVNIPNPSVHEQCEECPVDSVTWELAQQFIDRLYQIEDGKRVYRLPTEAEWEYAARAGTTGDRYSDDLEQIGWYWGNSGQETHPVGQKLPNAFGLHDMLGNVTEWVKDWSGGKYTGGDLTLGDPIGPSTGETKIIRGCSSFDEFSRCRSTHRATYPPDGGHLGTGFRLVLNGPRHGDLFDDHPNNTNEPSGASWHDLPTNRPFALDGDFASSDDVDYLRLKVSKPMSATVAVTLTAGALAEVRLGNWSEHSEPTGIGWRESCVFDTNYTDGRNSDGSNIVHNLEAGWYCVMARPKSGYSGAYNLVVEPWQEEGPVLDLQQLPPGSIGLVDERSGKHTVDLKTGAETLQFEARKTVSDGRSPRNFQIGLQPTDVEKTRVAIYLWSEVHTEILVEGKVIRDSYLSNLENYPIIVDLEPGIFRNMRLSQDDLGGYSLFIKTVRPVREELTFRNKLGMEFVKLPHSNKLESELGFVFELGSEEKWHEDYEGDFSEAVYPKPDQRDIDSFWIGRYEVTQCHWAALMEHEDVFNSDDHKKLCASDDGQKPVVNVTFRDAELFVSKLKYELGHDYRLLKEAEWEYAAQSGESGELYGDLDEIAWHLGNSTSTGRSGKKEPKAADLRMTGILKPNAFGLHDMLGNAWEWVNDDYRREHIVARIGRDVLTSNWTWTAIGIATFAFSAGTIPVTAKLAVTALLFKMGDANETKVVRGGSFTSEEIGSSVRNHGLIVPNAAARPRLEALVSKGKDTILDGIVSTEARRRVKLSAHIRKYGSGLGKWIGAPARISTFKEAVKLNQVSAGLLLIDLFSLNISSGQAESSPSLGFRVAISGDPPSEDHFDVDWEGLGDDHGDRFVDATRISLDESLSGWIGTAGDTDYFRLELSSQTDVVVYTTGTWVDTVGKVTDYSFDSVAENDNPPNSRDQNFRIEATLEAGTYYVVVEGRGDETGKYTLHVERGGGAGTVPPSLLNDIGMELVWIPAGEFDMGSTSDEAYSNEQPVTRVRISSGFYLGKHEVTQGQWEAVMLENPSYFDQCGPNCPVEDVSWNDVQEFINRLNQREGTAKYRLPTEAEWEYAARAGTTEDRYDSDLSAIAWYRENSGAGPHPVGQKLANEFGLHDMLGNVWERVQDRYSSYPGGRVTDPTGASTGSSRVLRGGSWSYNARSSRAPLRNFVIPGYRSNNLGFRLARDK